MSRPFFAYSLTGTPIVGYQDGLLCQAYFSRPYGITFYDNSLLVVDRSQPTSVRRITESRVASLKWTNHSQELLHPTDLTVLNDIIFIADRGHDKIRYIFGAPGELRTLMIENLRAPSQICVLDDDLLILDYTNLYRVQLAFSSFEVVVREMQILASKLMYPEGLTIHDGAIYVSNSGKHQILRIGLAENSGVQLFAGSGPGFADGTLLQAKFKFPAQICGSGDSLFVSDRENYTIRMIRNGEVYSLSQGLARGYYNGAYDVIKFNEPAGILAFSSKGIMQLVICDCKNACIRTLSNGRFAGGDISENLRLIFETDASAQEEVFEREDAVEEETREFDAEEDGTLAFRYKSQSAQCYPPLLASSGKLEKPPVSITSRLARSEVIFNSHAETNDETPLYYAYNDGKGLKSVVESLKSRKKLAISPYDALCQITKAHGFDMVKFHSLFANISLSDSYYMTDFILASGPQFVLPLCFGYEAYYEVVVRAFSCHAQLNENILALAVMKNLLLNCYLAYKPQICKCAVRTPKDHSLALARLSNRYVCVKVRTSCNGNFLRMTRSGEFRCSGLEGPALFGFEMQIVLDTALRRVDGNYNQFECQVECVCLQILSKYMYFALTKQDSFLIGNGKIELRIDDAEKVIASQVPFLVKLRCLDYYREIIVRVSQESPAKISSELPRVMQLQYMYCLSVVE